MEIFQHKDGELRLIEHGVSGTTYYLEILFTDANLTGPLGRALPEERLVMDRGLLDSNAHYVQGDDMSRLEPIALTVSCRSADTKNTQVLLDVLGGATVAAVGGQSWALHTRKGKGITVFGPRSSTALPSFSDSVHKMCWMVEVLYSGTSTWGLRWDEVYFPPAEQTITEAEDSLTINLNGQIYGGVTTITAFTSATAIA